MMIPLRFATDAKVECLRADGYRITGKLINGIPCLVAAKEVKHEARV